MPVLYPFSRILPILCLVRVILGECGSNGASQVRKMGGSGGLRSIGLAVRRTGRRRPEGKGRIDGFAASMWIRYIYILCMCDAYTIVCYTLNIMDIL